MVDPLGSTADAAVLTATVKPSSAVLFSRDLHVFLFPKPMHPLVVDLPAGGNNRPVDARTTETRPSSSNTPHLSEQAPFIGTLPRTISLGAAGLAQHPAGSTLGNLLRPQTTTHFFHGPSPTFGAYQFPWAASLRISMSRACSATSFFSREFSF